jgi:hypothetical protein
VAVDSETDKYRSPAVFEENAPHLAAIDNNVIGILNAGGGEEAADCTAKSNGYGGGEEG